MSRKNIFDIIKNNSDPIKEIERIEELLNDDKGVFEKDDLLDISFSEGNGISIINYVDKHLFRTWKQRGTCIKCEDMKETIGLDTNFDLYDERIDLPFILNYCVFVLNILYLQNKVSKGDTLSDKVEAARKNTVTLLEYCNHEAKYFKKLEKVLVVQKNAQATSVAEMLDNELSYSVLSYNHFLLKGDIAKKKDILLALANDLEPKESQIESLNSKLSTQIFALFNNLNIRHNNKDEKNKKNYKENVAKMKKSELEKWYDDLYQMILLAYLLLDNVERSQRVTELLSSLKKK